MDFTTRCLIIEVIDKSRFLMDFYIHPSTAPIQPMILLTIMRNLLLIFLSKLNNAQHKISLLLKILILLSSLYSNDGSRIKFNDIFLQYSSLSKDKLFWSVLSLILNLCCTFAIMLEVKKLIYEIREDVKPPEVCKEQNGNGVIHISSHEKDNMIRPKVQRILGQNGKTLSFSEDFDNDLLTLSEVRDFYRGVPTISGSDGWMGPNSMPFQKDMEISHIQLSCDNQPPFLHGFYSTMSGGMMRCQKQKGKTPITIKKSKKDLDKESFKRLLYEFKLTNWMGIHENILQALGVSSQSISKGMVDIIYESCETSLKDHLDNIAPSKSNKDGKFIPNETLKEEMLRWNYEIASGMNFIAANGIIHGALTTERILLTSNRTIKLTEFGVAPYLPQFQQKQKQCQPSAIEINFSWPWRNLPNEALELRNFSSKSDVYSFGIVIWEIFNPGWKPFHEFSSFSPEFLNEDKKLPEFPDKLLDGDILPRCLSADKDERPDFEDILLSMYKLTRAKRRKVSLSF